MCCFRALSSLLVTLGRVGEWICGLGVADALGGAGVFRVIVLCERRRRCS